MTIIPPRTIGGSPSVCATIYGTGNANFDNKSGQTIFNEGYADGQLNPTICSTIFGTGNASYDGKSGQTIYNEGYAAGQAAGGGSSVDTIPHSQKYIPYLAGNILGDGTAIVADFAVDVGVVDSSGFPVLTDGSIENWNDISGDFPIGTSTTKPLLKVDSEGYSYIDTTNGSYLTLPQSVIDMLNGTDNPYTIILIAKVPTLAATKTFFNATKTSDSEQLRIWLNADTLGQIDLTDTNGAGNQYGNHYSAYAVLEDNKKTLLAFGNTGEQGYFVAGQEGRKVDIVDINDGATGGDRQFDAATIGAKTDGTEQIGMHIYRVIIADKYAFKLPQVCRRFAFAHGMNIAPEPIQAYPAPSHAFQFQGNVSKHTDMRGNKRVYFTENGTINDESGGDSFFGGSISQSGNGYLEMVNTPKFLQSNELSSKTIAIALIPDAMTAYENLAGVYDGTNKHFELAVTSSDKLWAQYWTNGTSINASTTFLLSQDDLQVVFFGIDAVNSKFGIGINSEPANEQTSVTNIQAPNTAWADGVFRLFTADGSGGGFSGHIKWCQLFEGYLMSQNQRNAILSERYQHGGRLVSSVS